MLDYAIRRFLLMLVTLVFGSIVLFVAIKVLPPQDAADRRIPLEVSIENPHAADQYREALGIHGSLPEQYVRWATGFLTGDWGKSLLSQEPIINDLARRIPVSMELSLIGLAFTWALSFPLGIFAAIYQDRAPDYLLRTGAYALDALPSFVLAILLLTYLAVGFNWAPPVTFSYLWDDPVRHFQIMLLPTLLIGLASVGALIRFTRTFLLEVMRQDYIRTARSKGLPEGTVFMRHALRNVALPFITVIGTTIPTLLASSPIIELLFSLPGMGRYLVSAAGNLDYPVVMTTTMFFAIITLTTQLVTDLSYAWFDPRVSYARGS
jgi:peptide/nickel transport system permease protein